MPPRIIKQRKLAIPPSTFSASEAAPTEEQRQGIAAISTARGISDPEAFATPEGYQRYLYRAGLQRTVPPNTREFQPPQPVYAPAQSAAQSMPAAIGIPEQSTKFTPTGFAERTYITPEAAEAARQRQLSMDRQLPGDTGVAQDRYPATEQQPSATEQQPSFEETIRDTVLHNFQVQQGAAQERARPILGQLAAPDVTTLPGFANLSPEGVSRALALQEQGLEGLLQGYNVAVKGSRKRMEDIIAGAEKAGEKRQGSLEKRRASSIDDFFSFRRSLADKGVVLDASAGQEFLTALQTSDNPEMVLNNYYIAATGSPKVQAALKKKKGGRAGGSAATGIYTASQADISSEPLGGDIESQLGASFLFGGGRGAKSDIVSDKTKSMADRYFEITNDPSVYNPKSAKAKEISKLPLKQQESYLKKLFKKNEDKEQKSQLSDISNERMLDVIDMALDFLERGYSKKEIEAELEKQQYSKAFINKILNSI